MSDRAADAELAREIGSLIAALEDLQGELDAGDRERRRLPTPRDLLRFTSEVTIPATILVLETNVRVLKLLQRTIRLSTGEPPDGSSPDASQAVRGRAEALGRQTIEQLEGTLADLQSAVAGRPPDDEAAALLEEARRLRTEIESDLAAGGADGLAGADDIAEVPREKRAGEHPSRPAAGDGPSPEGQRSTGVNIDVESELESIRDQIDDENDGDDVDHDGDDGQ